MDLCTLVRDEMKIKDALDRSVRSRHVGTVMECLKHKDGLMYKELYADYCKRCKEEGIEPVAFTTIYTVVKALVYKGIVMRKRGDVGLTKVWIVK